ncbi:MAG: substrate-binding domain-containing protein [Firmicutes bacterium]|nr:substrate-binding domain-containing protein [Bacillota bacterium]
MNRKFVLLAALALVAVFMLAACGNGNGGGTAAADRGLEDMDLVVLAPSAAQGWTAAVIFFAEEKGAELRERGLGSFRVLTSDSVAAQAGQIEEVISQGVDAVVLFPHSDELTMSAQDILDADIPLFVFNRNVDVNFNLRLLGSNLLIGGEGARMIAREIGGSGTVAYLAVPAVGSTSIDRVGAFKDVMVEYPGINLVTMTADAISIEEGLRVTVDMLTANPSVDAIFTIDDQLAIGAYHAMREAGRTDIRVIHGAGGMQQFFHMIHDTQDVQLSTGTFSPTMVAETIELAVQYLEGRRDFSELFDPTHPQANVIIFPPSIVTRENAAEFFAPGSPW